MLEKPEQLTSVRIYRPFLPYPYDLEIDAERERLQKEGKKDANSIISLRNEIDELYD